MKNLIFLTIFLCFCQISCSHKQKTSGHSHNDYAQAYPLKTALEAKMGSIEADVFLVNNNLFVAHEDTSIKPYNTLENLYLKPIDSLIKTGNIYPFILLIDIKSQADSTLGIVVQQISLYNTFAQKDFPVKFVISGNRPETSRWRTYPDFILFDGRPTENYTSEQWQRIGLVSDSFTKYTSQKGQESIDNQTFIKMKTLVDTIHTQGKKVRFWATKDKEDIWRTLAKMGVDFINTDTPKELSLFLNQKSP